MRRQRMNVHRWVLLCTMLALCLPGGAWAQTFSSGSTGAQGAFPPTGGIAPPTGTTTFTISLTDGKLYYYNGSWTNVTLPNVPDGGFRDGILNFTTINIPSGSAVYISRNASNTPVVLLATGNVTLAGTIDVSGTSASTWGRPGPAGPGGFGGGAGSDGITSNAGGIGLGPGGGGGASGSVNGGVYTGGGGGGYGTSGTAGNVYYTGNTPGAGGATYGSSNLRPIVGGSGGGGGVGNVPSATGGGGGGGGGAIVIASSTSIAITGSPAIRANGGDGGTGSYGGGGAGSGGAIRLIAPTISGSGTLVAQGGNGGGWGGGTGGNGRIRLEATTLSYSGNSTPFAVAGLPQSIFPSTGQPTLAIASIGGLPAPVFPAGSFVATPDVLLPTGSTNPVAVVLTATNVPIGTAVQLTATPQIGSKSTATCSLLDGSLASSTCTASLSISLTQTNVLTASATFPLVASTGEGPVYAEGEEVKWVKLAAAFGGASTLTYVTASGREVPAELTAAP